MSRARAAHVAAIALTVALTSCSEGVDSAAGAETRKSLGECSLSSGAHVDVEPIHGRLGRELRWVTASGLVKEADPPAGGQSRRATVRLENVAPFTGGPDADGARGSLTLFAPSLAHAAKARDAGRDLIAGIDTRQRVSVLAAVDAAGDVAFVGDCQYRFLTEPFDKYVGARGNGRRPVDVLRDVVSSPTAAADLRAFFDPSGPPAWNDQSPDQRQIDPENTPAEVLAALRSVAVHYDLPAEWRTHREVELCTRLSIAWAECTALTAWAGTDGPMTFRSYAVPGERIEVWAVDEHTTITAPLGRVAVIPADVVARAVATNRPVVLRPVDGVNTFDEFRAAIAAGRDSLRVVAPV